MINNLPTNTLAFNPEKIYNFLIEKTNKETALEILLSFYYGFSIYNPLDTSMTDFRLRNQYKEDFINTIEHQGWKNVPNHHKNLLPLENNGLSTSINYGPYNHFKLYYSYFIDENIDVVELIYNATTKTNKRNSSYARKNFVRGNQALFRAMKYCNYNVIDKQQMFETIISEATSISSKEFQVDILSSLLSAYNQGYEKEKIMIMLSAFIKKHKIYNPKAEVVFKQLESLISVQDLKQYLTDREYKDLNQEDNGFSEKDIDATQIKLNLSKIRNRNNISPMVMNMNLAMLSKNLPALLEDLNDYVSHSMTTKNEIVLNILYEKNGTGATLQVAKALLDYCINLKEKQNTYNGHKVLLENLVKVKETCLLHHNLSIKLSENKETKVHSRAKL